MRRDRLCVGRRADRIKNGFPKSERRSNEMATIHETGQTQTHQANGSAEIDRLTALVRELQDECTRLRQALAQSETERNRYLKSIYENARTAREFEDVDIPTLKAMSAGPVEMIE
jgi:predicted  nucleic acid-binding Zn-ribbon protein